jgi:hypothetical protein
MVDGDLQGTPIIVRVYGFAAQVGRRDTAIPDGGVALTTGKLIQTGGLSPEVEVKAMVPGARPVSIPVRFLEPARPGGVKEEVIVFAGEHSGALGVVACAVGPLWELVVFDAQRCMSYIKVAPEHLVRIAHHKIRLGYRS